MTGYECVAGLKCVAATSNALQEANALQSPEHPHRAKHLCRRGDARIENQGLTTRFVAREVEPAGSLAVLRVRAPLDPERSRDQEDRQDYVPGVGQAFQPDVHRERSRALGVRRESLICAPRAREGEEKTPRRFQAL